MSIYQAQLKGKMYIGASKVRAAYLGNKLVYSGEEEIVAKNAPPFLSAGWKTFRLYTWEGEPGWNTYLDSAGRTCLGGSFQGYGTTFISETEIDATFIVENDYYQYYTYDAYLFYSPKFSIGSLTRFTSSTLLYYGGLDCQYNVIRHSNDGVNLGDWRITSTFDKSYKYAQVGIFIGVENTDDYDLGVKFLVNGVSFS